MYYEEKLIGGVLHYRTHPDGEFQAFTLEELSSKIVNSKPAPMLGFGEMKTLDTEKARVSWFFRDLGDEQPGQLHVCYPEDKETTIIHVESVGEAQNIVNLIADHINQAFYNGQKNAMDKVMLGCIELNKNISK